MILRSGKYETLSSMLILWWVSAITAPPIAKAVAHCTEVQGEVAYKIGKSFRTVAGPPTMIVHLSVKPNKLNREDMIILARELNERFHAEVRISVWIFDSYRSAKSFAPHPHSPTYDRDNRSFRGYYSLDRSSGKEYIQFSTASGRPRNEIDIKLDGGGWEKKKK